MDYRATDTLEQVIVLWLAHDRLEPDARKPARPVLRGGWRGDALSPPDNSVTILDNIDLVAVQSEAERKRVLDVFKKHGVNLLPDGRRVEDVVVRAR